MLEQQQLVTLLLKIAVSALLASILLRSGLFKRMLLRERARERGVDTISHVRPYFPSEARRRTVASPKI